MSPSKGKKGRMAGIGAFLAGIGALTAGMIPEIKRYLRVRKM
jgi:xanthine/uracil/vitamin C permease (AzgA family)